jgi:hypothetical protein
MTRQFQLGLAIAVLLSGCSGERHDTVPGATKVLQNSTILNLPATKVLGSFSRSRSGDRRLIGARRQRPHVKIGAA